MKLMSIQKDAQEIATSISEIMGVDVVIVDDALERVADTFHYPYSSIDIRSGSIIGRILKMGRPLIVDNKDFFQSCMDCKDRLWCRMQGLMGVPILVQGKTVGAIGLVVEESNVRHLVENTNLVLTFLQQMADLLSSKLSRLENYDSLQQISSQWEYMINTVDAGVVLLDVNNNIIVQNDRFQRIFGHGDSCCDHPLSDFISHPFIDEILANHRDVDGQPLVIPLEEGVFYGVVHIRQMWQNGIYRGAVFSFQDQTGSVQKDASILGMEYSTDGLDSLIGDKSVLPKLRSVNVNRDGMMLLHGVTVSEGYLRRIALALHVESDRPGKFVCINSTDWYGSKLPPVAFDLTDLNKIPASIMIAHQGTLCVNHIFDLPVCQQESILRYLNQNKDDCQDGGFVTKLIFLDNGPLPNPDSPYLCRGLAEVLYSHLVDIPNPLHSHKQLRQQLEQSFRAYADSYGIEELQIEESAWNVILNFPWDSCKQPMHKMVEYLVTSDNGVVRTERVKQFLDNMNPEKKSVQGFEQEQIQQMLTEGVPLEQIANILKISRSTLYRRIKKYNL